MTEWHVVEWRTPGGSWRHDRNKNAKRAAELHAIAQSQNDPAHEYRVCAMPGRQQLAVYRHGRKA